MHKEYLRVNFFKQTNDARSESRYRVPHGLIDVCSIYQNGWWGCLMPALGEQLADGEHQIAWGEGLFDNWKWLILVHWHALPGSGNE